MLDTVYLQGLPKDKILAALKICDDLFTPIKGGFAGRSRPRLLTLSDSDVKDALHVLEVLLGDDLPYRNPNKEPAEPQTGGLVQFVIRLSRETRVERLERIYRHVKAIRAARIVGVDDRAAANDEFEFEANDINVINSILSDLRQVIVQSTDLSEEHKKRLLKVAIAFQAEIDKPKSRLRVFLNGLIEATDAVGEAGEKAKPAFDRIREIFSMADAKSESVRQIGSSPAAKQLPAPPA